jgi:hypothetical protein
MHILSWLAVNGTAAIVEFPGVLYRGGAEQKIRQYLIDNNYVDAVIQLPPDLFFGTTIATCIIVLKKSKQDNATLFIDASPSSRAVGNKNKLTPPTSRRSWTPSPRARHRPLRPAGGERRHRRPTATTSPCPPTSSRRTPARRWTSTRSTPRSPASWRGSRNCAPRSTPSWPIWKALFPSGLLLSFAPSPKPAGRANCSTDCWTIAVDRPLTRAQDAASIDLLFERELQGVADEPDRRTDRAALSGGNSVSSHWRSSSPDQ